MPKIYNPSIPTVYLKESSGVAKTSSSPFHSGGIIQHESGVVSGGISKAWEKANKES